MLPLPFDILRYTIYLMRSITTVDDNWMGRPRSIATALLESDGHRAIVDPGPGSTLETLRQRLQAHGLAVGDLDVILLTHIHLDHAGATGLLVRENPRLAVRSEEHTSELQSPCNLVCRLLLEKKKKKKQQHESRMSCSCREATLRRQDCSA